MWIQIALFVAGIVAVYFGAEWLVRGSARLARSLGVSALLVGLTVVSLGTSAPELVVSALASAQQQGDLAVGNVIGSNILNIALVLGLAAVIFPLRVHVDLIAREIPLMILISIGVVVLAWTGTIGRVEGAVLLLALVAYLAYLARAAGRSVPPLTPGFHDFNGPVDAPSRRRGRLRHASLLVLGVGILTGGAHLLVGASLFFAQTLGISEIVIGITVVAIGTSLPELATSVVAAMRGETDIALGNAVGSNVFNLLAVLGVAALIHPLPVSRALFRFELPVMLGVSLLLLPLALAGTRFRISRWEGVILLVGYLLFTAVLLARATGRMGAAAVGL